MKIDLHTHTLASDGSFTPTELVTLARSCGVGLLALTDHDVVSGCAEAARACEREGIVFVPGIEVSSLWNGKTIHVVGLGVRYTDGRIEATFGDVGEKRVRRGKAIGRRFEALGISGAYEGALRYCRHPDALGRVHFARWLCSERYVSSYQEAFDKYLKEGGPAFVSAVWPSVPRAVEIILENGGIAVLAHPGRYRLSPEHPLEELISDFEAAGGRGIEVSSGSQRAESDAMLAVIAKERGLWASLGSDFHSLDGGRPRPGEERKLPPGLDAVWHHIPGLPDRDWDLL